MEIVRGKNILLEDNAILVHCANAQGVMGAGIALQIKQMYPRVWFDYREHLRYLKAVDAMGTICSTQVRENLHIVSIIGQLNYGRLTDVNGVKKVYVDYEALRKGFCAVNQLALQTKLRVIFPKIGAGHAGGEWSVISNIIEQELDKDVIRVLYTL